MGKVENQGKLLGAEKRIIKLNPLMVSSAKWNPGHIAGGWNSTHHIKRAPLILALFEIFLLSFSQQLLKEIEDKESKNDGEQDLEITWEPGLQETTEELVKNKLKEKEGKNVTPWEHYLQKRKQKKKEKRMQKESLKKQWAHITCIDFFFFTI